MRICQTHQRQLKRDGYMTPLKLCVLGCGRQPLGLGGVCRTCRDGLRIEGKRHCLTHGILPLDHFGKSGEGRCKWCDKIYSEGRYDAKCAMGCGRCSHGVSDLCSQCISDLRSRGLARCRVHGMIPVGDLQRGQCGHCIRQRRKEIRKETRQGIVDKALREQGHECPLCESTLTTKTARIDHDHDHGCGDKGCPECRRMMLCDRCNTMLGRYHDDPAMISMALGRSAAYSDELLRSAIDYLDRWNAIMIERGVRKRDLASETLRWMAEQMKEFLAIVS